MIDSLKNPAPTWKTSSHVLKKHSLWTSQDFKNCVYLKLSRKLRKAKTTSKTR